MQELPDSIERRFPLSGGNAGIRAPIRNAVVKSER
jgi:hypothetical protein